MKIKRLRSLPIEIFKTINNINPSFMKNIFNPKRDSKVRPFVILVKHRKSSKYGDKSLIALGRKIWNELLFNVKSFASITKFKKYIKVWCRPTIMGKIFQTALVFM